jgi:hypothetical protein
MPSSKVDPVYGYADPAADLPLPKIPRRSALPPLPRRPTAIPLGPRAYRVTHKHSFRLSGPGLAPAGFVTQQHTASEWVWYWASMTILDPLRDPRQPPFFGGLNWDYQKQTLDQIAGQHSKALSTNIDFFYRLSWPGLAVRIQTYRYHLATTSIKQAYDQAQELRELGSFDEIDVYEQEFLGDETGQAAIIRLKQVLGLINTADPLMAGTTRLTRNPWTS